MQEGEGACDCVDVHDWDGRLATDLDQEQADQCIIKYIRATQRHLGSIPQQGRCMLWHMVGPKDKVNTRCIPYKLITNKTEELFVWGVPNNLRPYWDAFNPETHVLVGILFYYDEKAYSYGQVPLERKNLIVHPSAVTKSVVDQ